MRPVRSWFSPKLTMSQGVVAMFARPATPTPYDMYVDMYTYRQLSFPANLLDIFLTILVSSEQTSLLV
jgi:hypothetical protein